MTVSVPAAPDILSRQEHALLPVRDVPDPVLALPRAVPCGDEQLTREPSRRRLSPVQDQGRSPRTTTPGSSSRCTGARSSRWRARSTPSIAACSTRSFTALASRRSRRRSRRRPTTSATRCSSGKARGRRSGAKERGSLDLVPEFTHQFPITVIEEMLALPKKDHPDFERWYVSIMEFLTNLSGEQEPIDRGLRTRQELAAYMLSLIASAARVTAMTSSRACAGPRSTASVSATPRSRLREPVLTAGGETTDRALANLFANLIANPDQLEAVYEDRSLVTDAFAETLRFAPPCI